MSNTSTGREIELRKQIDDWIAEFVIKGATPKLSIKLTDSILELVASHTNAARIDELKGFNKDVEGDPCICSHVNGLIEERINRIQKESAEQSIKNTMEKTDV